METIKLTEADFKNGVFCGKQNLKNIKGNLQIEATGWLRFEGDISAKGNIFTKGDISAGSNISAKGYISAGSGISAKGYISAGSNISAKGYISAGSGISAEGGMLKAFYGITAGLHIFAKTKIECGMRIFSGIAPYSWVGKEHKEIKCGKLASGEIAYGYLVETGLDEELAPLASTGEIIEINGEKYKRID